MLASTPTLPHSWPTRGGFTPDPNSALPAVLLFHPTQCGAALSPDLLLPHPSSPQGQLSGLRIPAVFSYPALPFQAIRAINGGDHETSAEEFTNRVFNKIDVNGDGEKCPNAIPALLPSQPCCHPSPAAILQTCPNAPSPAAIPLRCPSATELPLLPELWAACSMGRCPSHGGGLEPDSP